jgi:hypothetical protein
MNFDRIKKAQGKCSWTRDNEGETSVAAWNRLLINELSKKGGEIDDRTINK